MHVIWTESKTAPGHFDYAVEGFTGLNGRSRTPFLAAARAILASRVADQFEKLTGGRHGAERALSSTVGEAAKLSVSDPPKGGAPIFQEYNEWWAAE